jgi:hypothetical protein
MRYDEITSPMEQEIKQRRSDRYDKGIEADRLKNQAHINLEDK